MCIPGLLPAAAAAGGGAAAGIGTALQAVGAVVGVVGALSQGIQANAAAEYQAAQIEQQKALEGRLNSTEEQRSRKQFESQIAQQRADLIARGVTLDSPTAVFLGQTAAREMVFEGQAIRQGGQATQTELTSQQRAIRARGRNALFRGGVSAAGTFLNAAPDIWPELLA